MATPPPIPQRRPLTNTSNITPRTNRPSDNVMAIARSLNATSPTTGQGMARNPSLRGRPVRKMPIRSSIGVDEETTETEPIDFNAQLIAELKEQVERAEMASEQYRRQLEMIQQRLDESTDQQTAAEERDFAARTEIDKLMAEVKDSARQRREIEYTFESEREMLIQEKDRAAVREVELQSVVNRLTDTLKTRSLERASATRTSQLVDEDAVPPSRTLSDHEEYLSTLEERDSTIDALRLELADVHIKVAETEHTSDGRAQSLEKQLSDVKMQNARLVEENDSFQMLLGEKTLKGDFLQDTHSDAGASNSLAQELESVGENDEVPIEVYRKVEADLKNIREEKKALTLYIDKIIGRLLQHEGFEHIITGKDDPASAPMPPPKSKPKEKPLPLAPALPIINDPAPAPDTPSVMGGFMSRARSVVGRQAPPPRQARPMSFIGPPSMMNEKPETAPSIPISKTMGHKRARSDQMQTPDLGATLAVQQPNRGASPSRTASGSPVGAGVISPLQRAQTSYFAPPTRSDTVIRAPSQSGTADPSSSANSISSDQSIGRQSTEATSAQTSTHTRDHREMMGPPVTAGVTKQNQLRPLRLVQNQDAEEEARKKANRQSWMGNWFAKGSVETHQ